MSRELPEKAKRLQDTILAPEIARMLADPVTSALYENLEESALRLGLPDYSVLGFRDLLFLSSTEPSIAILAIDNDLFLDLLWLDVYTIKDLERRLNNEETFKESFQQLGIENSAEKIDIIQQAFEEWKLSRTQLSE